MNYYGILREREKYKIAENLYKCPICKAEKTIKGFMQHLKNHFFERDISNFRNAGNEKNKNLHRRREPSKSYLTEIYLGR